jgi:hypothetical protein
MPSIARRPAGAPSAFRLGCSAIFSPLSGTDREARSIVTLLIGDDGDTPAEKCQRKNGNEQTRAIMG